MRIISERELAANTNEILDLVDNHGESFAVERDQTIIAHIKPVDIRMTAAQALDGLGKCLSPRQGAAWLADSRSIDQ